MKRCSLIVLALLSINTGCIFGRSDGRPGFFSGLYNKIHGDNSMGPPCASGGCGQPLPPMMPQAAIMPGCSTCGTESVGYPEYPTHEEFMPSYSEGSISYGEPIQPNLNTMQTIPSGT